MNLYFTCNQVLDLDELVQEEEKKAPLICLLTTGSDPCNQVCVCVFVFVCFFCVFVLVSVCVCLEMTWTVATRSRGWPEPRRPSTGRSPWDRSAYYWGLTKMTTF